MRCQIPQLADLLSGKHSNMRCNASPCVERHPQLRRLQCMTDFQDARVTLVPQVFHQILKGLYDTVQRTCPAGMELAFY